MKTDFSAFMIELYKRFALKSPKFFQVLQVVGIIAAFLGFIPKIAAFLDIPIPQNHTLAIILKVAGATTLFMAKLPVLNSSLVMKTTEDLPFSEKKQDPDVNIKK
jgi:hypothetical protein